MLPEEKLLSDLFEIRLPSLKSVNNNDPNDVRYAPKKNYEDSIRVIKKHLKVIDPAKLTEVLYKWLIEQKYGNEELLHTSVCCEYVGMTRFKKAITELITKYLENEEK